MTANAGFVVFHGEYREIVTNERLVSTEVYEAVPDSQAVSTLVPAPTGGRTTASLLIDHSTQAERDVRLGYGMEGGMNEALDKLDILARSLT